MREGPPGSRPKPLWGDAIMNCLPVGKEEEQHQEDEEAKERTGCSRGGPAGKGSEEAGKGKGAGAVAG